MQGQKHFHKRTAMNQSLGLHLLGERVLSRIFLHWGLFQNAKTLYLASVTWNVLVSQPRVPGISFYFLICTDKTSLALEILKEPQRAMDLVIQSQTSNGTFLGQKYHVIKISTVRDQMSKGPSLLSYKAMTNKSFMISRPCHCAIVLSILKKSTILKPIIAIVFFLLFYSKCLCLCIWWCRYYIQE